MDFWMGAMLGLFVGSAAGVLLTCAMVLTKRRPGETFRSQPDPSAAKLESSNAATAGVSCM